MSDVDRGSCVDVCVCLGRRAGGRGRHHGGAGGYGPSSVTDCDHRASADDVGRCGCGCEIDAMQDDCAE